MTNLSVATPDFIDHLTGWIVQATFHNAETGFAILQVKVRGQADLVPVLGTLPQVSAKEWLDTGRRRVIGQEYGQN